MKNNKGITLTSLIIFIIGLLVLVGTMSMLARYYYNNFENITIEDNASKDYTKVNNFLVNDTNSDNIENVMISDGGTQLTIKFDNLLSHRYKFEDNSIFYLEIQDNQIKSKVRICKGVTTCVFTKTNKVISLNLVFNTSYVYNTSYTIK